MNKKYFNTSFNILQWFVFLLANAIALPIIIGGIFHLPIEDVSTLMQRTFLVVGVSSFIQSWFGHRYPIADGPAGSWVSIFVILGQVAMHQGQSAKDVLQLLEGGLIISGILLFVLGITGLVHRILRLFTPLVTGTFLLILALQLSGVLLKGMMGLQGSATHPDYTTATIALFVFALITFLSIKGRGWMKSYAVLLGISCGWLLYAVLGKSSHMPSHTTLVKLPEIFAWGTPRFDIGMTLTATLFTFLLVANTIAAISAVKQVAPLSKENERQTLNRGVWVGGISHIISSLCSTIGIVPLPASAGFIQLTGQRKVKSFLIASLILAGISFIPSIVNFISLLPGPIANAALLATLVQVIGISFQSILREEVNQRRLTILGISFLISLGIMFLPESAFSGITSSLQYVLSNGLLVGTILVILLEQFWKE
ncbi:xanthine permease [Bacillus cereus]|uniref:purine/pyrimidine permease n=1 Tax=Bacillus cereus TaxID=1396 RepID=UPI000BF4FEE3|nr:purine/pyrimidine permease [Bacillus cereus]PER12047.1 xanthine permease [Bacillus cereus]PEW61799.1 xanthine permease [Bacillus cereus]PEX52645.1 xanthine permease [Bacillus cereus]PEZ89284.1 xanthine permease [Bacillus cereus]PFE94623.1 xanthine permease [Bacillus cereus]